MKRRRCLFVQQGGMGKVPDLVTELWHQETFHVQEKSGIFLSAYWVMYTEKTTPIGLVTPIPLAKRIKFPQQWAALIEELSSVPSTTPSSGSQLSIIPAQGDPVSPAFLGTSTHVHIPSPPPKKKTHIQIIKI